MSQSRRMSAVETAVNITLGYAVSVGLQLAVFPAIGLSVTPLQSMQMGGAFTLASVLRGYALRRLFERQARRTIR